MNHPPVVLPINRLPRGYAGTLESPPTTPVTPKPAATLALLRKCSEGLEVLLLKRSDRARFIPGAHVFPGGRVEESDASEDVSLFPEDTSQGQNGDWFGRPQEGPPASAFVVAALRETFEETGILLQGGEASCLSYSPSQRNESARLRHALHKGDLSFRAVLDGLGVRLAPQQLTYIGHWVTPVQEKYRYDTRFFGAEVSAGCPAYPDGVELVESTWLTPHEALALNRDGRLPMVFPTIFTLQAMAPFSDPAEALRVLGTQEIPRRLPRVEETRDGIRMTL